MSESRTYTYRFENVGGDETTSPVAQDNSQPEVKQQPTTKRTPGAGAVALVAWKKVKPFVFSSVSHEISQVALASGANEQSQRAQEVWSLAQKLGDIVETTVVGTVLAGGNPLGALVGLGVGLLQTGVQYAQAYDRLNLERSIEEASLGIQRRRAATTNSRSSQ
nr:MAG TPA: hypothetical protein [Caudoviricetes sp.]